MKKLILSLCAFSALSAFAVEGGTFNINGQDYPYQLHEQKEIGPGVTYHRIRIPDYPLNINYMTVDLTNPYNRIETQQANERLGSTERLADAYVRLQESGKKPLGGQNGNFWVVSNQGIPSQFSLGATYNANLKNGQIITETNCYSDQWDGGPARTGVVGIDVDKRIWLESMAWKGTVRADRWGDAQKPEIILVNKYCRAAGEMTLYNSYYGRDKKFQTIEQVDGNWTTVDGKTCEIYLDLNEGQQWVTGKDFTATVKEVRTNTTAGTLGDYDMCLTGTSTYKTLLEQLQVGDVVTINYGWISEDGTTVPLLEQAIGGNAIVMKNGELTGRNYDETYNTQIYSRSAYGVSEDGKTLYMFVIDNSNDPVYGLSGGCPTADMCQIMKALGAWTVCNVDAGGSAQLMVQGEVVNRTTEGTPRAVANGWMVYSIAPDDADSNVVTRIEFLDPSLDVPFYSTYTPTVLGYNKYGELISENVEVELTVADESLGEAKGSSFYALGIAGTVALTAHSGDLTVTKDLNVVTAETNALAEVINDGREYPIELTSRIGVKEFNCDPSRLEWTVADTEVATVESGVLKGLKNGTTEVVGKFSDGKEVKFTVIVEKPDDVSMPVYREFPASDAWDLRMSGGSGLAVAENGDGLDLTFTGASSRAPYIQVASPVRVWSMPVGFRMRFNAGEVKVKTVQVSASNALGESNAAWVFALPEGTTEYPQNEEVTIDAMLSEWCDPADVSVYPLTINNIRISMSAPDKGVAYKISIPEFSALYDGFDAVSVLTSDVAKLKVYPNPVTEGTLYVELPETDGDATAAVYNLAGMTLLQQRIALESGRGMLDVSSLASGIYYVRIVSDGNVATGKIIVR